MSIVIYRGIMGSTVDLNSPIVKFNLTADPETREVNGSVEVTLGNPDDKPYKGNVTGKIYNNVMGPYVKTISIHGNLPSHNPLTPLNFPFSANMALEENDKGIGGFNFRGQHAEGLQVECKFMGL